MWFNFLLKNLNSKFIIPIEEHKKFSIATKYDWCEYTMNEIVNETVLSVCQ